MPNQGILRQVKDLQAQADRLIKSKGNMPEIEAFALFNDEVKEILLKQLNDEFVLNYIKTIPSLDIDNIETKSNFFIVILSIFFGNLGVAYSEQDRINKALTVVKEISDKYSSYEMMIKNCLKQ